MRTFRADRRAFTLIELMIVVSIIGVLAAIALPKFANLLRKTREGNTKGNLGTLRSSLSIYSSDNAGHFPTDHLESMTVAAKYLKEVPIIEEPDYHSRTQDVSNIDDLGAAGLEGSDAGGWAYWNDQNLKDPGFSWGALWIACSHTDTKGSVWTLY